MKRVFFFLLLIFLSLAPYAKPQKASSKKSAPTAVQQTKKQGNKHKDKTPQKPAKKGGGKQQKAEPRKKQPQKAQKQNNRQRRSTAKNNRNNNNRNNGHNTPRYTKTQEIKGLEKEKQNIQRDIQDKQKEYDAKETDVKQRLSKIESLSADIDKHQNTIDTIQSDIKGIDTNIGVLKGQIATMQQDLGERREKFIQSMRYMARHRSIQDKIMFIFSAKSLTQMYRRLRFVREYAAYQRAQGELLKQQQALVEQKNSELQHVRGSKANLLWQNRQAHTNLENAKNEQQTIVASLQQDQAVLQDVIGQKRQKQAALDAQIDRLISIEIEKARQRAMAEERARAAAQAAARKAHAAEMARKRAEAQRAAQENARRIAEARAREAKAREEARQAALAEARARREAEAKKREDERRRAEAAAQAAAARKAQADQEAREASAARMAAERKAAADRKRAEIAARESNKDAAESSGLSSADRALTGSFASNRGRLPMPMSGHIATRYGQYSVEGLNNVQLSNSGINIKGGGGAAVRSVYRGEVSAVFSFGGTSVVMVRHGAYITVYANLGSVSVHKGQQVGTGQTIGSVARDGILQFQLRKETAKLNPEAWLRH